jgi:hypothetical protein
LRVATAAHFDAVLLDVEASGRWDTIDLAAGTYETQGLWRFPLDRRASVTDYATLTRPIHVRGAGMLKTTIRLSADAVTEANRADRPDLCVMRFGRTWRNNAGPFTVEDLTIDGNQAAFPTRRVVAGGLVFHSNNVTCRNVRIIGLRGSFAQRIEAFGILVNNFDAGDPGPDGNNRLIDCVVESNGDVEEYVSPFYVGVLDRGRPMIQSEILGCRTIGTGSKPTRIGVSLSPFTVIDRFSGHNLQHAIYNDVGELRDATVRHSRFTGITYSGPWVIVDAPKDRVLIERCEFEFSSRDDGTEWIGLTVWDAEASGAEAADIVVRDCVFRGTRANKFRPVSLRAKMQGIRFEANVIPRDSMSVNPQAGASVKL